MIIIAHLLALSAALHPTDPTWDWPEPPEDMVDFLGRRRLCLDVPEASRRSPGDRREWARLSCATLPQEEAGWRSRYASDDNARRWLDLDPQEFHMPTILVSGYDGPPGANIRQIVLEGRAFDTGLPLRLSVDRDARDGRYTIFTVTFADVTPRSFAVDNERFPYIDLQSVRVAFGRARPNEQVIVELKFGYPRGYCSVNEEDDRPTLTIRFDRSETEASYQDRVNCRTDHEDLPNALPSR